MWAPKKSNNSNSNRVESIGRTFMTPYSTPFDASSVVSNESGGNDKRFHSNIHGSFNTYSHGSSSSRSSTNTVGRPSTAQQLQGSALSVRNTPHVLTNELSQLSLGSSHGHSGVAKTGAPHMIPTPGSSHVGAHMPFSQNLSGISRIGAPLPHPQNKFQDETGHISYMKLLSDSYDDDGGNVGIKSGYYSSVGEPQGQLGDLNIGGGVDYSTTQRQKEHLVHSHQYPMGRSSGFMFGAINSSQYPVQQDYDSSTSGTGFSFKTPPGNQDLHFHGSAQYQHFQQPKPQPLQQDHDPSTSGTGFSFKTPPGNQDLHFHGSAQYQHFQQPQPQPLQQDQDPSTSGTGFSFKTPPGNQNLHFHGSAQYQHFQQPQPQPQPLQLDHDPSTKGTGFSFPTQRVNRDLHFHGSGQYQHFQQTQPRFYNTLRGKDVAPAQRSQLGPDDYGLLGLLKIIKGVNPAKTSLAVGVDPHSLGLDLNSPEPLHQKFASPWSDEPLKEGPKFGIPECYNAKQPPPLTRVHFQKFQLDVLFYIFYSMPQDQAQLFAANELHDRGWYYHRELCVWFAREKNSVPSIENSAYEVGCYMLFNPHTWQITRQDNVMLRYDMIEQRPPIPPGR